jgi:hypothetical protein
LASARRSAFDGRAAALPDLLQFWTRSLSVAKNGRSGSAFSAVAASWLRCRAAAPDEAMAVTLPEPRALTVSWLIRSKIGEF